MAMTNQAPLELNGSNRKTLQQQFYDRFRGGSFEDEDQWANLKFLPIAEINERFVQQFIAALPGRKILDYCCGSGEWALRAAELGAAEVVGIDISPVRSNGRARLHVSWA